MIDNKNPYPTKFPQNESWSIDYFKSDDWKSKKIIRKFINSAIYVEKPILGMPPLRKKSPIFLTNGSDGEFTCRTCNSYVNETVKTVRSCTTPKNTCLLQHSEENPDNVSKKTSPKSIESYSSNTSSDAESQVTVKSVKAYVPTIDSEVKLLDLASLSTDSNCCVDLKDKQKSIMRWLHKKNEELKKKKMEEERLKEEKDRQKQLLLEKERENFKKWLMAKKQAEERSRKMKELEQEEKKLKEVEKDKKRVENELCFNKWLRRKKKMDLGTIK